MLNKIDFSNSINLTTIKMPADLVYQSYINKHFANKYNNKDFLKTVINESSLEKYSDLQKIYKLFKNSFTENEFYKIAIDEIAKLEIPNKEKIIEEAFKEFFNDESNIKYGDVCSIMKTLKDTDFPEKNATIKNIANHNIERLFNSIKYSSSEYPFCENDIDVFLKHVLSKDCDFWLKEIKSENIDSAVFYNLVRTATFLEFPDKNEILGDFINKNFDLITISPLFAIHNGFDFLVDMLPINEYNLDLVSEKNFLKYINTFSYSQIFCNIKNYDDDVKNKNKFLKIIFAQSFKDKENKILSNYKKTLNGIDKNLLKDFIKDNLDALLDIKYVKSTFEILQNFDIANKEDILKEYLFKVSEKANILPDNIFKEIDQKYLANFINSNSEYFTSPERISNTLKFIKKLDFEDKPFMLGKIFNVFLKSPGYNINTFFDIALKNDVKENIDLLDEKNKIITFKVAYENNNAKIEMIKENENGFDVKNLLTINATPNEINNYLVENIIESIPKKHESSGFVIDVQDKDFFYITKKPELLKNISETADKKYFVDHNNLYVMQSKENFNNFDNYQNKKTSSLQSLTAIFTMNAEKIKHFDVLQVKNEEEIIPINKKEEIINKINEYATKYSLLCEKISSDDNLENDEFKDLINNNLIKSIENFLNVANEDIISQKDAEKVFNVLDKHFSLINKSITSFSLMSSQKFEFNNETKKMLNEQKENTKAIISNVSKEIEDDINTAFFNASLDQSATLVAYNILIKNDNSFVNENIQK